MKHTITVYNVQKSQKKYIKDIATNNLLFVQKVSFAQINHVKELKQQICVFGKRAQKYEELCNLCD